MNETDEKKNGDDTMAVLAVPCEKPIVVSQKQGEKILNQIQSKKASSKSK